MKKASLLPVKVHIGYIYVWLQRYFSGQISFCEFWIGSPNFTATGKLLLFKVSMERSCSLVLLAVCGMFQFESKSLKAVKSFMHSSSCWLYQFTEEKGHWLILKLRLWPEQVLYINIYNAVFETGFVINVTEN